MLRYIKDDVFQKTSLTDIEHVTCVYGSSKEYTVIIDMFKSSETASNISLKGDYFQQKYWNLARFLSERAVR